MADGRRRQVLADIEPIVREDVLQLDARFLPSGIRPGNMIEVIGPSGSGKTIFITYMVARFLAYFPDKRVLLVDTRGHFNYSNLVSMLQFFVPEVRPPNSHPGVLQEYLNRLKILKCYDGDHLISLLTPTVTEKPTVDVSKYFAHTTSPSPRPPEVKRVRLLDRFRQLGAASVEQSNNDVDVSACPPAAFPSENGPTRIPSPIEEELLLNPDLSLLIFDGIDAFAHSPTFYTSEHCRDPSKFPSITSLIQDAVNSTKTPVICTLAEYILPNPALLPKPSVSTTPAQIPMDQHEDPEHDDSLEDQMAEAECRIIPEEDEDEESEMSSNISSKNPPAQNIIVEKYGFTHSIALAQLPNKNLPWRIDDTLVAGRMKVENNVVVEVNTAMEFSQMMERPADRNGNRGPHGSKVIDGNDADASRIGYSSGPKGIEFSAAYRVISGSSSRGSSSRGSSSGTSNHRVKYQVHYSLKYALLM